MYALYYTVFTLLTLSNQLASTKHGHVAITSTMSPFTATHTTKGLYHTHTHVHAYIGQSLDNRLVLSQQLSL